MKFLVVTGTMAALVPVAAADNVSGVFSPVVREGDVSAQYRLGYDPDSDAWAQRIHIQSAFNTTFRGRLIAQIDDYVGRDADLDYLQAELMWQLTPDENEYQTALRFDARYRPDGRPDLFRAIWTNQFPLTDKLTARALLVTGAETGNGAFDGISLETRFRLIYDLDAGPTIGLELFNAYGTTDEIRDFEDQRHQFGPYVSTDLTPEWDLLAGIIFGLNDRSDDANLRIWLGRSF